MGASIFLKINAGFEQVLDLNLCIEFFQCIFQKSDSIHHHETACRPVDKRVNFLSLRVYPSSCAEPNVRRGRDFEIVFVHPMGFHTNNHKTKFFKSS